MPLAVAAIDARTTRRIAAAAIAAALQGVFYWLILHEAVEPIALPTSTPLEVTLFSTPARRPRPKMFPRKQEPPVVPSGHILPRRAAPPVAQPITPAPAVKSAPHAPIDWQHAMQGEVRRAEPRSRDNSLNFGFPQLPAGPAAPPEFGWYYAGTHRVQALPEGGTLLNLTDHCGIVIYVLPIPFCKIGRIPANGQLFDHMYDGRNDRLSGLP